MKLEYRKVNKENLRTAAKIQYEIFPEASAYTEYLKYIKKTNIGLPIYYLIYLNNEPIGTAGLYEKEEYPDTIWISWFGLLKDYRNRGLGKKILFDMIEKAKNYNKKWLRLFTYEIWNSEAQPLYNKYMQISEYYKNKEDNQQDIEEGKCKIYGYSLCDEEITLWGDKFIDIGDDDEVAELSKKLLIEDKII